MVDHVEPASVDLSILYPVISEPPLFAGDVHDRLILDEDASIACKFCGADGEAIHCTLYVIGLPRVEKVEKNTDCEKYPG